MSLEDVIDLEQEALAETGNIILNGCLSTIANMLERSLKMSLPEVLHGEAKHFFNLPPLQPGCGKTWYCSFISTSRSRRETFAGILRC